MGVRSIQGDFLVLVPNVFSKAGQHLQDCGPRVVATERLQIQCARNANQLQAKLTPSLVLGKSSDVT